MNVEALAFLGSGPLFTLQQIVFGLAAIVSLVTILLELTGRTVSAKGLTSNAVNWNAKAVATAAIVGAISVATQPLQITIIPGFSAITPSKALAPIFSVLFGVPGMVGAAFSLPIQDAVGGFLGVGSIGGVLSTWLVLCWLPYKLVKDPSFRSAESALQFFSVGAVLGPILHALFIANVLAFLQLLAPEAAFSIVVPTILLNHGLTAFIIAPALLLPLFPRVQAWGLYWRDDFEAQEAPVPT